MNIPRLITLTASLAAIHLPVSAQDYTLHEWGTFTTVAGSDGTHLDGVEREEAPLPGFVHQLDELRTVEYPRGMKGLDYRRPLDHVNVRMETPVIYFYTDQAFDVQVDVGFHGGAISQWFPDRSAGEKLPPILRNKDKEPLGAENVIDFGKPRGGSIRWNVRVEPAGEDQSGRVFQGGESPCWLHPRQTDSALVTNARGQTEKYLFYRGVGRLNLPVIFSATDKDLKAANGGRETVGHWLVFDLNDQRQARWSLPAPVTPASAAQENHDPSVFVPLQAQPYRADWKKPLYADAVKMLVSAGLYRKEADAMLQTWWDSYFERPGLRVFWIVPRSYVDEVLPLTVSPAPKNSERVIVGRTEILTPAFEQKLLAGFAAVTDKVGNPWAWDRFLPAYTARVEQLKKIAAVAPPQPPVETSPTVPTRPNALLPVGKWNICFANGAAEDCEIRPDGTAAVTETARTSAGRAAVNGASVEIRYDDDRAERWTMDDDWLMVEHWFPASTMATAAPVRGVALRAPAATGAAARQPVWTDRISSAKLGRNVRIMAYENADFGGACLVMEGVPRDGNAGGTYPEFRTLTDGLAESNTWNDRISSLRIVSASAEQGGTGLVDGDPAANKAVLFGNANFEGESVELTAGTEVGDLAQLGLTPVPMKVHEWGTFTVLEGADGNPVEWYQSPAQIIDLPPFVERTFYAAGKSGTAQRTLLAGLDTIRMETPVLYFYPDKEMDITVSASFPQGRITEVFPPAILTGGGETVWSGRLLPPNSSERMKVPAAPGKRGRHYAAARAVPDAWLFRGHRAPPAARPASGSPPDATGIVPGVTDSARRSIEAVREGIRLAVSTASVTDAGLLPAPKLPEAAAPIDHFIFYRGAGNRGGFEIKVVEGDQPGTFTLTNSGAAAIPRLLALRVRDGQTSWLTIDQLAPVQYVDGNPQHQRTVTFTAPAGAAAAVAPKLREVMIASLISEGLTSDEAAAMVATWDDLWFTEPGTRILALLPREFADAMVPLMITPPPAELDRVFVARVELISREQEQALATLLTAPGIGHDPKAAGQQLEALNLGRFAAGGLERATALVSRGMRDRFNVLSAGSK